VEEQAALRRVATLVAKGATPNQVFDAVRAEVAQMFDIPNTIIMRFDADDSATLLATPGEYLGPVGTRWRLKGDDSAVARVYRTGRAARADYTAGRGGPLVEAARLGGTRFPVAVPVVVDGALWGAMSVGSPGPEPPPNLEGRLAKFTELLATAIANTEARTEVQRLADEQAALRRVATLVAEGPSSDKLFAAVAGEVADVLGIPVVGLHRFEGDGTFTVMGLAGKTSFTVGSRWPVEDEGVAGRILATGRPARKDDYTTMPGPLGDAMRDDAMISTVGVPIVVEGAVWGFMVGVANTGTPIPDDTEKRFARFTALVATAIANTNTRLEVSRIAEEQAALRRVATMVARAPASEQLFSAIAREVASVLDVPGVIVTRHEPDGTAVTFGEAFGPDLRGAERFLGVGTSPPPDPGSLAAQVRDTHSPARVDDFSTLPGTVGDLARAARLGSGCAGPIVVNGAVWGKMCVFSPVGAVLPPGTEDRLQDFIDLVATAIASNEARADLAASEARARQLADEQAALQRVATLVAKGAKSEPVFSAVAQEVAHVFGVQHVTVCRYEPDTILVLSSFEAPEPAAVPAPFPAGRRLPLDVPSLPASVYRTGEPVRIDDFTASQGLYALARQAGLTAAAGVPIVVDGTVWGAVNIASTKNERLLPDAEERLARFTELVATSVSNATMREELAASEARARELADEQAALRRVATLVARGVEPEEMFSTVTNEMAQLFGTSRALVGRFEPDGSAMVVVGVSSGIRRVSIGSRWQLEDYMASAEIYRTGHPVRFERSDFEHASGPMADVQREVGAVSIVGAPIVVEGKQWGFVTVTDVNKRLPADTEKRLEKFAELVATAIANAESRADLAASEARARELADEQAALRRVATLVARGVRPEVVFSAVSEEVGRLLGTNQAAVARFDPDGPTVVVVGATKGIRVALIGTRWPLEDFLASAAVYRTGRPARIEKREYENASGAVADALRELELVSSVATPIVVEGELWGVMTISGMHDDLPPGAEKRLEKFTELVGTAIANAESRAELAASEAWARALAEEQASLRRVATLVAEGPAPTEVFDAVIAEVGQLLGAAQIGLARYENEHEISVLAIRGQSNEMLRAGVRLPLDGDSLNARILRTGRSARLNFAEEGSGSIAEVLRPDDVNATVGAPIVVDGALWGMIGASWRGDDQPPADAEERLAQFAELLATAVSNAVMRTALAASRARVIAAADEGRRRIERDLHDGAQQRLVTLAVALQRAQAKIPSALDEVRADVGRVADGLTGAVNELRDLSRGIHPAILTEGGLSPALKALGRRSAVRVKLDVGFEHRLPDQVEVAAYYTVSEALTNASKHANATRVWVSMRVEDDMLLLSVRDDGEGGADATRGSGLTGLRDRIEALGGKIEIKSPSGSGTVIEVEIPIA
jgi:GAF domain-containing protein